MEDSRKKLYDTLSKSYNLGTFEEFNDKMGYEESRKKLYDTVSEKYNLGDFDTFNQKMGTTYQADKEALEQQMDEWGASNGSFMKEYEDAEKLYKSQSVFGGSGAIDTPQSIFVYDNAQEYGKKRSEIEEMRRRYYSNPLVIKQREGDAGFARQMAEGFATEAKRVEQENPELARKAKAANAAALNPRGAMTGYITDDVKQYNEDRQNYETARRMAESAQDIYAAPSKYDDSIGVVNFLKGGRDVANKADFWTMGMVGIADNLNARDALMKVQEKLGSVDDLTAENIDSILTPSEKAIVTAFATNVMAQASRANDLSRGYQAGQGAMESLGFMAQFLLTQGLGSAAAKGASKGIAKAVSKGAADSMTKWLAGQLGKISSSTVKSATKSAAKGVVGTIESVVKASVMTPMIPQTWKTVSDEMLEINDAGQLQEASTAFWHGLGDAMIETWSENAGGMVEKILGVPLSAGKSVWNKALGKTDFGKWGANLTRTPAYNLMKQAGWNGFIAEMGEEFVGNTVRTVTGLDSEALQDFTTVDNLLVTAASFAPMTIIGLGTSAAQYGAAKKRATKAAEHLAQVMKGAGYTPEQIAFTIDDMNASTPVQLSQSLTPVVNQIAKDSGQGSYAFKAAMEYADAMARYRTLDGFYKREQTAQIEDARENIMAGTGQQFWQTREVADGVTTDNVRVITTKEGIRMFVTGESEDGMLAVVKENGEKRFVTPDQLANTAGPIPEGEVIVSDESMSLNDFLRSEVVSKKKDAEQQRMSEEANAAIETIRQAARPGTQINLGTAEVPVIGNIVQQIPDGVVVQSEAGVSQLTWEEAGNAMNIAVKPMTDAEIEQQEIDAIEAERAAKELERAKTEQEAVQAGATEIVSTEEAEDALPLPLKADGSVDQTALWNQSPERWARWNDDQRQDDGINSANYISSALARAQKDLDQTVKAYGNESDFDARASLESDITAKQERVNRLAALQQSYIPQEAMQEGQAEQTSVPAKPLSSQHLKEKQKRVERTLESEVAHLYELGLNNEEVAANLDAKIAKAQKDLEAQSKKAPLMEADAEAYIEKKRKYEEKMSALQQEADFWSEAKEAVNNLRAQETQMPEAPSEVALGSDPEPQNGVELAARELGLREGGIKLLWDSFERHTGYGSSERSKFFGLFRTKAKGGMTIEQAGERLMELDRENNTGFFDQNDPNAGTNAILDALSDNDTIGQLRSYVARQRKAEAEREAKAAYSSMNAYYEQTFGEKLEDTALYDEIRSAEILASGLSESEQQELNNIIFAEEISQYGTEGYQTEASGVYESEVAGNATNVEPGAEGIRTESVGVLQGAQSDNSGRDAEPEEGQRGSEGETSEQDALPSVPSGESATAVESSLDEDMPDFSNQIEQVREEVDTDPSEAQKKAGNYKMGHLHLDGYNITIENPKGSVRRGTDSKGNEWENTLNNDYGYIRGTEGVDGDHIDVYLSDNPAEGNVYVIDQVNPETREFDEHKVMYGFNSIDEAREAYLANFSEGWNGLGTITEVTKDEFRKWIDSSHRKTKPFSEYKSVRAAAEAAERQAAAEAETTRQAIEMFTPQQELDRIEAQEQAKEAADEAFQQRLTEIDERLAGAPEADKEAIVDERAAVLQEYLDGISSDEKAKVVTPGNFEEVLRADGCSEGAIKVVAAEVGKEGIILGGFMVEGHFYVMSDIASVNEARRSYVHERQHVFTRRNPSLVDRVLAAVSGRRELQMYVQFLAETDDYEGSSDRVLADEIISFAMERAYSAEDFVSSLVYSGIQNPKLLTVLKEIYNEQKNDNDLSKARRRTGLRLHERNNAQRARQKDVGDTSARSRKVGEQGLRPAGGSRGRAEGREITGLPLPSDNRQLEGNVRFSKSSGTLVGMHNLSEEKLRKVIRQGGSANPSTAVVDIARQSFDSYGDISLVMPSSLVDAGTGRNAGTFTADAWTPIYPQVVRRFSDDKLQRVYWKDISALPEEMQGEVRQGFDGWRDDRNSAGLAYMFLHERGEAPELVRVEPRYPKELRDKMSSILNDRTSFYQLSADEKQAVIDLYIEENFGGNREKFNQSIAEHISRIEDRLSKGKVPSFVERRLTEDLNWMKGHGYHYENVASFVSKVSSDLRNAGTIDENATTNKAVDYIKEKGLSEEFERWKEGLAERYGIKEYLFAGYTPSGDQKWLPNTIENASRLMNKEGLAGSTGFSVSFNRFVATLAPKKKSLSDIRSAKERLTENADAVEEFREKWTPVYYDLGIKCQPDAERFEDYGLARLEEAAQKKNPGAYLKKEYGVELSQEDLQKLSEMIKAIKTEFPARYFETKFQRPVYLQEFAAAVMPTDTSDDIKQAVSEAGLPVFEYDPSVEGSRRDAALKASDVEGVRFRKSNENQAVFVSNAAKAVEGIRQEKATPEQWLKMIEKNGGLKAGEDKWMGLSEWLKASDKKTLTKQEVLDFINENMIVIEEVHYAESDVARGPVQEAEDAILELMQAEYDMYVEESQENNDSIFMSEHYDYAYNKMWDIHGDDFTIAFDHYNGSLEISDTEAASIVSGISLPDEVREIDNIRLDYTTEGLTHKHEIALTVPTIDSWNESDGTHFGDAGEGRAVAWIRFGDAETYSPEHAAFYGYQEYLQKKYYPERKIASLSVSDLSVATREEKDEFVRLMRVKNSIPMSSRMGRKVLVIDEIQSKRHQEGREKGYSMTSSEYQRRLDALETEGGERLARRTALLRKLKEKYGDDFRIYLKSENTAYVPNEDVMTKEEVQEWYDTSQDEINDAIDALKKERRAGIPDAPFDKNWHELAMKRMLRYAAENGYDVIAWTKGEQQAERYNLGKFYSGIERQDNPAMEGRRFVFYGGNMDSFMVNNEGIVIESTVNEAIGRPLSDIVGKDLAVKMMQMKDNDMLDDADITIGGEGMKGFYDKMLPAFMNKYGKKWGVKVEDIKLPLLENGLTMHSVPVTDEMKESVMEGQVMFQKTGITSAVREEMDRISANAVMDGKFMLAPNGKPTNLTADQWALVRTEGFKKWFGDWELPYRMIDVVRGNMAHGFANFDDARQWAKDNIVRVYGNEETGGKGEIEISNNAVKKYLSGSAVNKSDSKDLHLAVLKVLPSVIRNGVIAETHADYMKDENGERTAESSVNPDVTIHRVYGAVRIGDNIYRVKVTLKKHKDANRANTPHSYEATKIELLAGTLVGANGSNPNTNNSISAANLLKGVEKSYESGKYLLDDYSKVVDENGEPMVVYHGSDWNPADEEPGNAVFMKDRRGIWFTGDIKRAQRFAAARTEDGRGIVSAVFLNIRKPSDREYPAGNQDDWRLYYELGYDGWLSWDGKKLFTAVVKSPSQIKSATDNTGEFSAEEGDIRFRAEGPRTDPFPKRGDSSELMADALPQTSETTLDNTSFEGKDSDYLDNNNSYNTDDRFRTTTGTPTEDIVENGLQLSVQNYARLAGDIFAALPENMRREVVEDTFRNGIDMQRAILQIPTRLAEKDDLSEVEVEVAKMIAGKVQDALLADGVLMTRPLTTAEAIWMLYKHNNAGNDILSAARRSVVADNLGFSNGIIGGRFSNEDDIRFRASRAARADSAARMYNTEARLAWRRLQESWQDMNVSVDSLMRALETASGKAIQAFENIAMALNRLSSKNLADKKKFLRDKLMPLWEKVLEISDKFKVSIEDIERYMMLKHGLERNLVLAARDARNYYKEELEKELSRIDKDSSLSKSEKKAAKAKAEATYQRHLKNIENGTDSEYLENRKKDYGGLTSLYSDYADYGTREDYDTEEEYQEAAKAARTPKYKTLEEAENAAVAEVGSFEAKIGGLTVELWHKVNAATKDTLKHQYNHGMLTKEQYESVRDMFEYYVPLRGFKDNTVEDMYSYYGSGQQNDFAKPLQAAKGRKTEAESPLGWIGSMAESAIQMDNKNDAKLRLYYLAVNRPDNDLMKITETWYEWTGDYNAEGKKIFEPVYPTFSGHLSGDSMQAKMDSFDSMMEQQAMQGNAFRGKQRIDIKGSIIRMPKTEPEHVVNVKVAGKDYSILINGNPRAAQAINGLLNIDNADANGVYRGFRAVLRMMSALSTSYNPEFWISNFQRDMMYAFIGTSIRHDKAYTAEFAKNYIEAFKVISMLRKNKKGALGTSETESYYKEFSENGGVTGYTVLVNNAEYDKMLREFQKDQQKSDFIKKVKSGFEAVADFGEAIEQVSRFAAYMTSRKMGKGIEESVNEAKEITVNFNRKGSGKAISWEEAGQLRNRNGKPLNWAEKVFFVTASGLSPIGRSVYMFFNASIQGLSAAAKLARNNPKKSAVWAGIFLSMGMLNAVLHAMLDDDDDYLDMPEYEKRTNLLIGGNGVYFKWALPQEVRPFYAMADIFVNHAMGRAPHKNITEELASVFADLLPVNTVGAEGLEGVTGALMPSYVSPIYQVIINKDFKGAPIYREMPWIPDDQQKDVPAYTKAYSGTGSLYVNVSEMLNNLSGGDYSKAGAININPAVVEHIVEGYGGGTLTTANKVLKSLGMIAGTEDISFRSMPFLSRILTVNDDRYRNAHTTELYNYYKGISDQAKRSYNAYEKQRDGDKLSELMRSEDWKVHQIFLRYKKMLDYYDKQLKLASTEDERRTIMREQDAQRKRVIEEISRLR